MSLNRRKNRQSVGWSSEMERGGWAGGPSRAPWSLRYLHEGAPSRLPLAGWGLVQRTPVDSQTSFDWVVRTGAVPAPLGGYGTRGLIKRSHPGLTSWATIVTPCGLCAFIPSPALRKSWRGAPRTDKLPCP